MSAWAGLTLRGQSTRGRLVGKYPARELSGRPRRALCEQVRREEPNCWLCGLPIDLALPRWPKPHPLSSVIDERIPRSKHPRGAYFAAHDRSNLRHAHRLCNGRRGNRLDYVQPVRSRQW